MKSCLAIPLFVFAFALCLTQNNLRFVLKMTFISSWLSAKTPFLLLLLLLLYFSMQITFNLVVKFSILHASQAKTVFILFRCRQLSGCIRMNVCTLCRIYWKRSFIAGIVSKMCYLEKKKFPFHFAIHGFRCICCCCCSLPLLSFVVQFLFLVLNHSW